MLIAPDELHATPSLEECYEFKELPVLHLLMTALEAAASAISATWTPEEQEVLRGLPSYREEMVVRDEVLQAGRTLAETLVRYRDALWWRRTPPDDGLFLDDGPPF